MVLKTGYLFSGQLSETPQMGIQFNELPYYRKIKDEFDHLTDGFFSFWTEEEDEEGIHDRFKAAEGNFLFNLALAKTLKEKGVIPEMVAGYSVGFFSACVFAGCVDVTDALHLIRSINKVNKNAFPPKTYLLAAETGLNPAELKEVLASSRVMGIEICNINNNKQVVFSGSNTEVDKAIKSLNGKALSVKRLSLDVPLHSKFMERTCREVEVLFHKVRFFNPEIPVVTTMPDVIIKNGDDVRFALLTQLKSTIDFPYAINYMIESGITAFIEVGPSDTISRMVKWIKRDINIISAKEAMLPICS